ncbi:MAG: hypothetical protein HY513_02515 [Candidatus Aenigmarchaeota archaeon]|nr:hypothetical protein [Candidatus Aenigmarchaeota archaeon]
MAVKKSVKERPLGVSIIGILGMLFSVFMILAGLLFTAVVPMAGLPGLFGNIAGFLSEL